MASLAPHLSRASLTRPSLLGELRALGAVVRREWLIFVRYPSWVIGLIIWPLIFPAVYILTGRALAGPDGSGLAIFEKTAGTTDFLGYIAVGTTVWMWQNVVLWNVGMTLREEQLRGTIEANWLTPAWRFSYLVGASVTQLAAMLIFLTVSALEFGLVFGVHYHGSLGLVLLVLVVSALPIYGLAITFASLVLTAREAGSFVQLVRGLVMIFCGITFPVSILPGWMQSVAVFLPQTYIIRAFRAAALGGADFRTLAPDLGSLLIFGAIWLALGYFVFQAVDRRARRTGAIGKY